MNVLALELSTTSGSLAVFRDGELCAETQWTELPRQHQQLFDSIASILAEAELTPDKVDLFAAGRGPGNYTGLRMSLTAAKAMALPGDKPIHCVDSGVALARALDSERSVTVVGDARRQKLWAGIVRKGELAVDWQLVPTDDFAAWVRSNGDTDVVVSPDHARLTDVAAKFGDRWLDEVIIPNAVHVGELALEDLANGRASKPETPLYLQAAV